MISQKSINRTIICFLVIILLVGIIKYLQASESFALVKKNEIINENIYIQKNSLIGISEPCYSNPDKIELYGIEIPYLLYKIIECESNFQPDICNADYGCSSGIGLSQLTAGAIKNCEKGLEKTIDPYNGQDNLECSLWLYEKYGTSPWGCPDCWWGSYDCWKGLTE